MCQYFYAGILRIYYGSERIYDVTLMSYPNSDIRIEYPL